MLAGARAVRTNSRVLPLEVPVSSISRFRRFNVRIFYPLLGNSLIILKELSPLSVRKIWINFSIQTIQCTYFLSSVRKLINHFKRIKSLISAQNMDQFLDSDDSMYVFSILC